MQKKGFFISSSVIVVCPSKYLAHSVHIGFNLILISLRAVYSSLTMFDFQNFSICSSTIAEKTLKVG